MTGFFSTLFEFEKEDSIGEKWHFRLLELFVVWYVIKTSWDFASAMHHFREVVHPLGLAIYVDPAFMHGSAFSFVNAGLITVALTFAFMRRYARIGYPVAALLFHWQYVCRDVLGEIGHSSHFVGISLVALALGFFFFREERDQRRFVSGMIFFFIGLGYFSAAVCKLIGTGIDWSEGRHLWLWIHEKSVDGLSRSGQYEPNWFQSLILGNRTLGTIVLSVGILTELAGPLLWFRKARLGITLALIGLHIGIMVTMNIYFYSFILQLLVMGLPWDQWFNRPEMTRFGHRILRTSLR